MLPENKNLILVKHLNHYCMNRYGLSAIALLFLLASCGAGSSDKSQGGGGKTDSSQSKPAMESTNSNLQNSITVQEKGLKITKAMLLKEDGTKLGEDNTVGIGEVILCRLFVEGWHVEGGQVKLGAYEDIKTEDGATVLKEEDLFKDMVSASVEDAQVVTLRATITNLTKSIRDFKVNFRVWDKVSNAEVTGSFPFHLK